MGNNSSNLIESASKALSDPKGILDDVEGALKDPIGVIKRGEQAGVFSPQNIEGMANMAMNGIKLGAESGGALASMAFGPEFLPMEMPEEMRSAQGYMHDIMKVVNDGNFEGITGDAMGDNAGQIGGALKSFGSQMPNAKGISGGLENAKNIMFRGSGITPIGEISKIISPIKSFNAGGGMLSGMTDTIQNVASIEEGKKMINTGNLIPPGMSKGLIPPTSELPKIFPGVPTPIPPVFSR